MRAVFIWNNRLYYAQSRSNRTFNEHTAWVDISQYYQDGQLLLPFISSGLVTATEIGNPQTVADLNNDLAFNYVIALGIDGKGDVNLYERQGQRIGRKDITTVIRRYMGSVNRPMSISLGYCDFLTVQLRGLGHLLEKHVLNNDPESIANAIFKHLQTFRHMGDGIEVYHIALRDLIPTLDTFERCSDADEAVGEVMGAWTLFQPEVGKVIEHVDFGDIPEFNYNNINHALYQGDNYDHSHS